MNNFFDLENDGVLEIAGTHEMDIQSSQYTKESNEYLIGRLQLEFMLDDQHPYRHEVPQFKRPRPDNEWFVITKAIREYGELNQVELPKRFNISDLIGATGSIAFRKITKRDGFIQYYIQQLFFDNIPAFSSESGILEDREQDPFDSLVGE